MAQLPPEFEIDYLVYSASGSLEEESKLWDYPLEKVYKRMLLKKFDSWVEYSSYEDD